VVNTKNIKYYEDMTHQEQKAVINKIQASVSSFEDLSIKYD